jgi:DNA-binding response OmpR family regulator
MFERTLIIDNDARFSNSLKISLQKSIQTDITVVNDLSYKLEDPSSYDLYIIRLDKRSDATIKQLSDDNKFIILITNQDTEKTREKILSYFITDYVIISSIK